MLNKIFIKKTKEKLLAERAEILNNSVRRPEIDTDGDETDKIQANILLELHNQFNNRNVIKLTQISDALQRIEDNVYGVCEDCEENILEKRLLVNPYFLTCVSCAEERETEDKQRKRL